MFAGSKVQKLESYRAHPTRDTARASGDFSEPDAHTLHVEHTSASLANLPTFKLSNFLTYSV